MSFFEKKRKRSFSFRCSQNIYDKHKTHTKCVKGENVMTVFFCSNDQIKHQRKLAKWSEIKSRCSFLWKTFLWDFQMCFLFFFFDSPKLKDRWLFMSLWTMRQFFLAIFNLMKILTEELYYKYLNFVKNKNKML